jgi:hypothetical protein
VIPDVEAGGQLQACAAVARGMGQQVHSGPFASNAGGPVCFITTGKKDGKARPQKASGGRRRKSVYPTVGQPYLTAFNGGLVRIIIEVGTSEQRELIENELKLVFDAATQFDRDLGINKIIVPVDFDATINALQGTTSYQSVRNLGDQDVVAQRKSSTLKWLRCNLTAHLQ